MTTTIEYIDKHVMPVLEELQEGQQAVEKHLVKLNGRTDHVENRVQSHTQDLKTYGVDIAGLLADVSGLQATTEVTGRFRDDQVAVVRANARTMNTRLWHIAGEVAKVAGAGGVAALVFKALESIR